MKKLIQGVLSLMMVASLGACSSGTAATTSPSPTSASESAYTAGTYTGEATGHNGTVKAEVTFSDNAIESVKITEQSETPFLSDKAIEEIPEKIVKYQTTKVDSVSGATFTSAAIKNAVNDAVKQAGGDSSKFANATEETPEKQSDMDTDVLVIGGGASGLMAAETAATEGAKTVLVEKLDSVGGTLAVSAGLLLTVDSETTTEVDDSLDRMVTFFKEQNSDSDVTLDYDFASKIFEQTGSTVDYLRNDLKLEGTTLDMGGYVGTQFTIGYELCRALADECEKAGVTVLTGTKAESLVVEDGAVTGATVSDKAGEYTIHAKKVIVAAGGASWSDTLKEKQPAVKTVDLNEKSCIGNTGDGMKMLEDIGAQMADTLYVKSSQPDFAQVFGTNWSNTPDTSMTLMVDAEGKRFTNEGLPVATEVNEKMLKHASSGYWNIIDVKNAIGFDADFLKEVEKQAADDNAKVAVKADTIEELAKKIGVDADTLKATFDEYQAACDAGKDDEFGKSSDYLKKYSEDGGYYAVYRRCGSWGTIGGAIIDENMHVLDKDGNVIPNVYAIGETATSQLFGDYYFGGYSLGSYTTEGRIAAKDAVSSLAE